MSLNKMFLGFRNLERSKGLQKKKSFTILYKVKCLQKREEVQMPTRFYYINIDIWHYGSINNFDKFVKLMD